MATRNRFRMTDTLARHAKNTSGKKTTVYPDGDGLRLLVYQNGNKVWQLCSSYAGKSTTIQIGRYPDIPLAQARSEASNLREKLRQGINPAIEKRVARARSKVVNDPTFRKIAEELLSVKKKNVSSSYYKKLKGALSANLFPQIGKLPIAEIDPPLLRSALLPIEKRGSLDMLAFVRRVAGEVFDLAKALGYMKGDNPASALTKNVFQRHRREHFSALSWDAMLGFLHRLDGMNGTYPTIVAIRLLVLTATRSGEVRGARWDEFDLDRALWTIPPERMKKRIKHVVPLARQTVQLLNELKQVTGNSEYLFPSQRGAKSKIISDMTLLKAVRRHVGDDVDVTVHGFRAVFRTHAEESGLWSREVMECAIAHSKGDLTEAAYARATHLPVRAQLAQWYADQLDELKHGTSTLPRTQRC